MWVICVGVAITNQTNNRTNNVQNTQNCEKRETHTESESDKASGSKEHTHTHTHRKRMKRRKKKNDNYIKHNYKARAASNKQMIKKQMKMQLKTIYKIQNKKQKR